MKKLKLLFFACLVNLIEIQYANCKISDKRLCADPKCEKLISLAKTLTTYPKNEDHMVSFSINRPVRVMSKSAGINPDIWGVDISGVRGYAPKKLLREEKVYVKFADLIEVPTEPYMNQQDSVAVPVASSADQNQNSDAITTTTITTSKELKVSTNEKVEIVNDNENNNQTISTEENSIGKIEKVNADETNNKIENVETKETREHDDEDEFENEEEVDDENESSENVASDKNVQQQQQVQQDQSPQDPEEASSENEANDDDKQYAGQQPVSEEPSVKKDAYKVGDDVRLEIIGGETEVLNETDTKPETENMKADSFEPVTTEATNDTIVQKNTDTSDKKTESQSEINVVNAMDEESDEKAKENTAFVPVENNEEDQLSEKVPQESTVSQTTSSEETAQSKNVETSTQAESQQIEEKPSETAEKVANDEPQSTATIEKQQEEITPPVIETSTSQEIETLASQENEIVSVSTEPKVENVDLVNENNETDTFVDNNVNQPSQTNENQLSAESTFSSSQIPILSQTTGSTPGILNIIPSTPGAFPKQLKGVGAEIIPKVDEEQQTYQEKLKSSFEAEKVANKNEDGIGVNINENEKLVNKNEEEPKAVEVQSAQENPALITEKIAEEKQKEEDIFTSTENFQEDIFNTVENAKPEAIKQEKTPKRAEIIQQEPIKHEEIQKPAEMHNDESKNGGWLNGIMNTLGLGQDVTQLPQHNENVQSPEIETETDLPSVANEILQDGYCEKLSDGSCPKTLPKSIYSHFHDFNLDAALGQLKNVNYEQHMNDFLLNVAEKSELVVLLVLTTTSTLVVTFIYFCFAKSRREGPLISRLNIIEKKLLVSEKECVSVKNELIHTRNKLASIEDSSFGSNDMVISLKEQLTESENDKQELHHQISNLEKELEAAAEAGLELNKMVSELLNNQSGSDSIISSVEELQRQLNEQEETTLSINNLLAEKSRENSELMIKLSELSEKFNAESEELLKQIDVLKMDKETLEGELKEQIHSLESELNRQTEARNAEIVKLKKSNHDLKNKLDTFISKIRVSEARADSLEDMLKKIKDLPGKDDLKKVIDVTETNAKLLAANREKKSLFEKLETEADARKLLEEHVKAINEEIAKLRNDYSQAEKEKLEAQTRLEVLSNYFKDKETQLQKELSVKEAIAMKQQGESTNTVERIRGLQDEIQELKSRNDQLRAEIDAQLATHKAQINAAESRAHDSWLSAKQAERRLEEARSEASVLRRKLTTLSTNPATGENNLHNHVNNVDGLIPMDMNAPSPPPLHMESPGSPMNVLPPVPFLPPPPFIPGAPGVPFMPPPPLVPITSGEMRLPPLGRLMSPPPPPPNNRYSPNSFVDDRRYSNRYSPDSRYADYPGIYETETDYSPRRSPEPRYYRDRDDRDDYDNDYSPPPSPPVDNRKKKPANKSNKGGMSSGSIDSSASRKSRNGVGKV